MKNKFLALLTLFVTTTVLAKSAYQVYTMPGSGNISGWGAVNLGQSAAVTGTLPNANTTATNANTANAIVARDSSGNFSAGTITANLNGNATTATTASTVTTNANLTGDVTSVGNATTLPNIVTAGTNPKITYNAKGQVTAGAALSSVDIPNNAANTSGSAGSVSGTNVVTNSNLSQMAANTYKGNNTGVLGNALDLTSAQVTADLNLFSSTLQGLVPGSGGGTSNFLRADGTWAAPAGSVTSVGLSAPAEFTVSGSPVTGAGTLTFSKANQNANLIYAGPSTGVPAAPSFRSLVAADLPGAITSNTSGNAATVTTNANLTGPITSVGNTTSVASQTGTGSKFVMDTSPTLITPNLGTPSVLVGTNITGTAAGLSIGGNAATATQFAAAPSACPSGQFVSAISSDGTPTCSYPSGDNGAILVGTSVISNCSGPFAISGGTLGTSYVDFVANSGCTIVNSGAATSPGTQLLGFNFASLQPGDYSIEMEGAAVNHNGGYPIAYQFTDGTNYTKEPTIDPAGSSGSGISTIKQTMSYSTAQTNVAFKLQTKSIPAGGPTPPTIYAASGYTVTLRLWYFPSSQSGVTKRASWTGYHKVSTPWTTTSSSFVDVSNATGITLTQQTNSLMGTVTTASGSLPGITLSFPRVTTYRVCAIAVGYNTNANHWVSLKLQDGSNNDISTSQSIVSSGNGYNGNMELCGNYAAANTSSVTFKIKMANTDGAGTANLSGEWPADAAITWSIQEI